jgi:hypothetical protein
VTKIYELKEIIDINERLLKQKDEEISKIIKKQEEQDKHILELQQFIKKDSEQKQNTEIELNKNKRKLSVITNDYIEQLIQSKKKAHPWSKDMSKYICISKVNNKWRWETTIFNENYKNFNTKEEAIASRQRVANELFGEFIHSSEKIIINIENLNINN